MDRIDVAALESWIGKERTDDDVLTVAPARAMSALMDRPPEAVGSASPLPPAWHWLYFNPIVRRSALGADGHERRGSFLPPVPLPRRMWAGGRLRFLGTPRLGESVRRRSTIASVRSKEGRSGPLVFVTVHHEIANEAAVVIEEEQDLVYRGAAADAAGAAGVSTGQETTTEPTPERSGPTTPASEPAEWSETFTADAVTLFRFSALTANSHRIHYDHRYVTEVEGYPDLVVHGPLIALLLLDAGSRWLGRPTDVSYRAVGPLFCGEEFAIEGRATGTHQMEVWATHPERGLAMQATIASGP